MSMKGNSLPEKKKGERKMTESKKEEAKYLKDWEEASIVDQMKKTIDFIKVQVEELEGYANAVASGNANVGNEVAGFMYAHHAIEANSPSIQLAIKLARLEASNGVLKALTEWSDK